MFKEMDRHVLVAVICFIVGTMCLMLNVVSEIFNLFFVLLFMTGLLLIIIKKIKDYRLYSNEISSIKESMTVDMTLLSDGSFELSDTTLTKKQLNEFKYLKREKITVIFTLVIMFFLMGYFAFKLILAFLVK